MKKFLCFFLLALLLTLPAAACKYYYTQPGDSMAKIAVQNHVALSAVREYNPALKTGKLPEGTLVYVPISKMQAWAMEKEVVRLVNAERKSRGLPALRRTAKISRVACLKAEDMRDRNYFSHTSPTYGTPFEMLSNKGVRYAYAGENIAMGQVTAQEVVQAWMNSKGHRENILNPNYTKIGVGCCDNVQGPYWVQLFAG